VTSAKILLTRISLDLQVELMEIDTVASAGTPGFDTLGITPQPIERVLEQLLGGGPELAATPCVKCVRCSSAG